MSFPKFLQRLWKLSQLSSAIVSEKSLRKSAQFLNILEDILQDSCDCSHLQRTTSIINFTSISSQIHNRLKIVTTVDSPGKYRHASSKKVLRHSAECFREIYRFRSPITQAGTFRSLLPTETTYRVPIVQVVSHSTKIEKRRAARRKPCRG